MDYQVWALEPTVHQGQTPGVCSTEGTHKIRQLFVMDCEERKIGHV